MFKDYKFAIPLLISLFSLGISAFNSYGSWKAQRENIKISQVSIGDLRFDFGISLDQNYLVSNLSDKSVTIKEAYCSMFVNLPGDSYSTSCAFGGIDSFPLTIPPGEARVLSATMNFRPFDQMALVLSKFRKAAPDADPVRFLAYLLEHYGIDYAQNPWRDDSKVIDGSDPLFLNDKGELSDAYSVAFSISSAESLERPVDYYYAFRINLETISGGEFESELYVANLGMPAGF
ncbi:hypothetical protein [Primorskyibacter flagellatus]|nr:hypothetical protein [Primorskyibacter flagellatus]